MSELEVKAPEIGESVEEVLVGEWFKDQDQQVEKDEKICELESGKANVDVYAPAAGSLNISVDEGTTVNIGDIIATIDKDRSKTSKETKNKNDQSKDKEISTNQKDKEQKEKKVKDDKLNKDLKQKSEKTDRKLKDGEIRESMDRFRKSMAKHLSIAQKEVIATTSFNDVDLHKVISVREASQEEFQRRHDVKLGFMSFFVKATVAALKEYPIFNSQLDGDNIIKNKNNHIGIAISRGSGLVVPVLKNAQEMDYATIEQEIKNKADKAKNRNLDLNEMTGGTFTITNGGVFGSLLSTPILNPPQVAILGMHRIEYRPIAKKTKKNDYKIEVRPMMNLALTYDHRLIEGKEAVKFLNMIKDFLEKFDENPL